MNLSRSTSSWTTAILAALALVPLSGCHGRTDVQCGTTPVEVNGKPSGLESCSDGVTHRAAAVTCESKLPRATICGGSQTTCATDGDCTEKPFGQCDNFGGSCDCRYGCETDADCQLPEGPGICLCGALVGVCSFFPQCTTDADCSGSFCTVVHHPTARVDVPEVACLSPDNECEIDTDCGSDNSCFADLNGTGRHCSKSGFDFGLGSGRPFLVEGGARRAELTARDDWSGEEALELSGISASEREAIAEGWARAGLLEHASIAAFARFTLQLLALGAPPALVLDAQAAIGDETEHAKLCFTIASAYAGRPLGPGKLALEGALTESSAPEILVLAILEGCIGETVAAIEAAEMAERAAQPALRRALARISADEARHAELAWRFVQWAITEDASLGSLARDTFAAAIGRAEPAFAGEPGPDRSAHGLASAPRRRARARQTLLEVVRPCAEALLASAASGHHDGVIRLQGQVLA
jgi:hypothetical protein